MCFGTALVEKWPPVMGKESMCCKRGRVGGERDDWRLHVTWLHFYSPWHEVRRKYVRHAAVPCSLARPRGSVPFRDRKMRV